VYSRPVSTFLMGLIRWDPWLESGSTPFNFVDIGRPDSKLMHRRSTFIYTGLVITGTLFV